MLLNSIFAYLIICFFFLLLTAWSAFDNDIYLNDFSTYFGRYAVPLDTVVVVFKVPVAVAVVFVVVVLVLVSCISVSFGVLLPLFWATPFWWPLVVLWPFTWPTPWPFWWPLVEGLAFGFGGLFSDLISLISFGSVLACSVSRLLDNTFDYYSNERTKWKAQEMIGMRQGKLKTPHWRSLVSYVCM